MRELQRFPELYKKSTSNGKISVWKIWVEGSTIHTESGYIGQKMKSSKDTVAKGKNIGRSNETTPHEQAVSEAKSKHQKYQDKGYHSDLKAVEKGKASAVLPVPRPMLAQNYEDHASKITFPCYISPKLEGTRALSHKGGFYSRGGKPIGTLQHIEKALKDLDLENAGFDGEVFHPNVNSLYEGVAKKKVVIKTPGGDVHLDKEDIPKLQGYSVNIGRNGYPIVSIKRKSVYIHRLVLGFPDSFVDHIDGNPLNACKDNLRTCTASQNTANSPSRKGSASRYKGVMFFKRDKTWHAQITKDYKKYHIGYFGTEKEAAVAYDLKAVELFGDFARLNFPEGEEKGLATFENLVSAVKNNSDKKNAGKLQYHIFDYVSDEDFSDRYNSLQAIFKNVIKDHEFIKLVPCKIVHSKEEVEAAYEDYLEMGYEGAMIRSMGGPYEGDRRSYLLQKLKPESDSEFRIVGVEEGRGALAGKAVFVCEVDDERGKRTFPCVLTGKGVRDTLGPYLKDKSLWEGKWMQVKYFGLTRKNFVPRHPRGMRIRDIE